MRKQTTVKKHTPVVTALILFNFFICCTSMIVSADPISEIHLGSSSNQVVLGQQFTVTISISPTEAIGGWSLDFRFPPNLVKAINVTPGLNWTAFFSLGEIDNLTGTISEIQTWSTGPYPATNHTLCTIRLQAVQTGVCYLSIEQVHVTNSVFDTIPMSVTNTTVTVSKTSGGSGSLGSNGDPNGYLIDTDQDGIFDVFHDNETGNETEVEKQNDAYYLIDSNGDGIWDYLYDLKMKTMKKYDDTSSKTPQSNASSFILGGILSLILVLFVILLLLARKREK